MIVVLDTEFLEISPSAFEAHSTLFEYLLFLHSERRILFCLPPAMTARISRHTSIGPLARSVISSIQSSYLDYSSMKHLVRSKIRVVPDSSTTPPLINADLLVGNQAIVRNFITCGPYLYLENAPNDGSFYEFLITSFFIKERIPRHLSFANTFHGGGNALGAAMAALQNSNLTGLCICDRDTAEDVPPFPLHSTGASALSAALMKGAISSILPPISAHPFFSIRPTLGWSMENYIGPHLLEAYFQNNPEAAVHRSNFVTVFPSFPALAEGETVEWFVSHYKSFQNAMEVRNGLNRLNAPISEERATLLGALQIPRNVLSWVISNAVTSRHTAEIRRAIQSDLCLKFYFEAVREIAMDYVNVFAADANAKFA
jgi:hypothetical protein